MHMGEFLFLVMLGALAVLLLYHVLIFSRLAFARSEGGVDRALPVSVVVCARNMARDLEELDLPAGTERLLFRTDNSRLWEDPGHRFRTDYCALTLDAAEWVAGSGVRLVGIDYHSIQRFHDPADTHVVLLEREIVILEGLDLRQVEPGPYRLWCLPIKLKGVEGASARAVLEPLARNL